MYNNKSTDYNFVILNLLLYQIYHKVSRGNLIYTLRLGEYLSSVWFIVAILAVIPPLWRRQLISQLIHKH